MPYDACWVLELTDDLIWPPFARRAVTLRILPALLSFPRLSRRPTLPD